MQTMYVEAEKCEMTLEQMAHRINELSAICDEYQWQYEWWKTAASNRSQKIAELERKLAALEAK